MSPWYKTPRTGFGGATREEFQEPRLIWDGRDTEFQQPHHIYAYVGGEKRRISNCDSCGRGQAKSSRKSAIYIGGEKGGVSVTMPYKGGARQ